MTTRTQPQTSSQLTSRKSVWWLMLSLLLVAAALAAYRVISTPAAAAPAAHSTAQTLAVNPEQHGVSDYLWAHHSDQPPQVPIATLDSAQQSVMNYLHVHERVDQSPTLWDQAAQAVRDYLRAHSR